MSELHTIDGKTQSIRAWAREYGTKANRVYHRLNRGWTFRDALTIPRQNAGMTTEQALERLSAKGVR